MRWNRASREMIRLSLMVLVLGISACSSIGKKEEAESTTVVDPAVQARQEQEQDYRAALALQQEGELDAARRAYERLLEENPGLLSPRFNLAAMSYSAGDQEDAESLLKKILAIDATHKQANNLLGVIARERGEFDQAETYYRAALTEDPGFAPAIRNLGILLDLYQGRFQEALSLYEQYQSLQSEPDPKVKDWIFDLKRRIGEP